MRFYTASKLGSKRAYTSEGYLVCLDVPIARTGEMLYAPGEIIGLQPGKDGLIRVRREAADVFEAQSLASFVGKPTTNDHPDEMVNAKNWRRYAAGSGQNVRQGDGEQADLVLADLIWTDPAAIADIESGKDEISNGYDAEYEEIEPGVYRQVTIRGNHIALVAEGRCGSRCAIGDSAAALQATTTAEAIASETAASPVAAMAPTSDEAPSCGCGGHSHHRDAAPAHARPARAKRKAKDMAAKKIKGTMLDRVRRAFSTKDEAGFEEAMTAVEEAQEVSEEEALVSQIAEAVAAAVAPVIERIDAVEAVTNDLKKARDEAVDPEKKDAEAAVIEGVVAGEGNGGDKFAEFLKSKGLGDEDIAEACAKLTTPAGDSAPSDMGSGNILGEVSGGDFDAGGGSTKEGSGVETGGYGDLGNGPDMPGANDEAAPETEADKAKKAAATADGAGLAKLFRDTVARAEILAPGIKLPTYDGKAKAKPIEDSLCALRRLALKSAFDSADRKAHVAPFVTDAAPDFGKMSCGAVKLMFVGASELAAVANKAAVRDASRTFDAIAPASGSIKTMADRAKALWDR